MWSNSSVVEYLVMVQCVLRSIPPGEPIKPFLIPARASQLVFTILSMGWCIYKNPLLLTSVAHQVVAEEFLSHFLNGL